jgi:hypothetical protein
VTYTSYIITLSHTTATTLGASFSGNLPAPVQVFSGTNHVIQWAINQWVGIDFTTAFNYNGTDNLVVSLQKVYDRVTNPVPGIVTQQTTGAPHRTDLVTSAYAFSPFGGGGSTTDVVTNRTSVLSMRLLCTPQGTTTLASLSQPGPTGAEFQIGTNATLTIWAASGSGWATMLDVAFQPPVTIPPVQGSLLLTPLAVVATGVTASGSSALTFGIPNNTFLVGSHFAFQSITVDPTLTTLEFTNGVDCFIR